MRSGEAVNQQLDVCKSKKQPDLEILYLRLHLLQRGNFQDGLGGGLDGQFSGDSQDGLFAFSLCPLTIHVDLSLAIKDPYAPRNKSNHCSLDRHRTYKPPVGYEVWIGSSHNRGGTKLAS